MSISTDSKGNKETKPVIISKILSGKFRIANPEILCVNNKILQSYQITTDDKAVLYKSYNLNDYPMSVLLLDLSRVVICSNGIRILNLITGEISKPFSAGRGESHTF